MVSGNLKGRVHSLIFIRSLHASECDWLQGTCRRAQAEGHLETRRKSLLAKAGVATSIEAVFFARTGWAVTTVTGNGPTPQAPPPSRKEGRAVLAVALLVRLTLGRRPHPVGVALCIRRGLADRSTITPLLLPSGGTVSRRR